MSRSALVGYTGFVGGTLHRARRFDALVNSKNADDLRNGDFDLVIHAGVPAVKWIANKEPAADRAAIEAIRGVLATMKIKELILISTIDVYPDPSARSDENAAIDPARNHAYGRHRLELEQWVRSHFANVRIVRLPALFGDGLKKNVVFDLLHDNQVGSINPASRFQWYPLSRLHADIEKIRAQDIRLINLFPEPLPTSEIVDRFFPGAPTAAPSEPAPAYDLRTTYSNIFGGPPGYTLGRAAVMDELAAFIGRERAGHARRA
jgi:RmlD substrate binding domain